MFTNSQVQEIMGQYQREYNIKTDSMQYGSRDYRTVDMPEYSTNGPIHVEFVDTFGGEGDGAEISMIYRLSSGLSDYLHIRMDGYYSSYSDTTWDGAWYIVNTREEVVIRYDRAI